MRPRTVVAALVVALGCRKESGTIIEPDAAVEDARDAAPIVCDPGLEAIGPACIPRFDRCAAHEIPSLGGGCVPVGVPKDGCAKGFVFDGEGACVPTLPTTVCAEGAMAVPGETSCHEIAPCGSGTFGDVPIETSTIFVDGSYALGSSDGTKDRPFVKIADAIAIAGTRDNPIVAVAAGTYPENLVIASPMRLWGRCPAMVKIVGSAGAPTLDVRAKFEAHRLAITGADRGVLIDSVLGVRLEELWVHHCGDLGIGVRDKTGSVEATIRSTLVEKIRIGGIAATGGTVTIESSLVRGTTGDAGTRAEGITASGSTATGALGTMTVRGSIVEGTSLIGIGIIGSTLLVDGSVVRDTGHYGIGSTAAPSTKFPSKLTVVSSSIERATKSAIYLDGGVATIERTSIRDTATALDGTLGRGVWIAAPSGKPALSIKESSISGCADRSIAIDDGDAEIASTIVRDTKKKSGLGCGICAQQNLTGPPPKVVVHDSIVRGSQRGGIASQLVELSLTSVLLEANVDASLSLTSAKATGDRIVVRDSLPRSDETRGMGILLTADRGQPSKLALTRSVIESSRTAGIVSFSGIVDLFECAIRNTRSPGKGSPIGFGVYATGHPLTPAGSVLTMKSTLVEQSVAAGVFVGVSSATLESCVVRDTAVDATGHFGDGVMVMAGYFGGPETTVRSTTIVRDSLVRGSARAGVSVFGSDLTLARTTLACNAFDLDLETHFDPENLTRELPVNVDDKGENACGCTTSGQCKATSNDLAPISDTPTP